MSQIHTEMKQRPVIIGGSPITLFLQLCAAFALSFLNLSVFQPTNSWNPVPAVTGRKAWGYLGFLPSTNYWGGEHDGASSHWGAIHLIRKGREKKSWLRPKLRLFTCLVVIRCSCCVWLYLPPPIVATDRIKKCCADCFHKCSHKYLSRHLAIHNCVSWP